MADIKSARVIAEERAIAQGELANSFKEAGVGAVRSLEMNIVLGCADTVYSPPGLDTEIADDLKAHIHSR